MKKSITVKTCFVFLSIFFARESLAATNYFLIWHPGEAGTTEQAQPILDAFAQYLQNKLPNTTWSGKYFSTVKDGESFIKKSKPQFGIFSDLIFQQYRDRLNLKSIATTKTSLNDNTEESWYLLNGTCSIKGLKTIYATQPITQKEIISNFASTPNMRIEQTNNILGKLRAVADGECAHVLISERTWRTLGQLHADWTKKLQATVSAHKHSTPRVARLPNTNAQLEIELVKALRDMNNNEQGNQILKALQITSFE